MRIWTNGFVFLLSIFLLHGCYYDNKEDLYANFPDASACDTIQIISFKEDIQPLFDLQCKGCHGATGPSGGLSLTDYATISSGIAAVLDRIKRPASDPLVMPQNGKLPQCDIQLIEKWVENGMINN